MAGAGLVSEIELFSQVNYRYIPHCVIFEQ